MSTILIENLGVEATHGLKAREREKPQLFIVDIWARYDSRKAERSDAIGDACNYARLREIAQEVLNSPPHNLLEKLVGEMADKIMEDRRVSWVKIKIRKPHIWNDCVPGVEIERERSEPWSLWNSWIGNFPF